jgi:hypothetical protein
MPSSAVRTFTDPEDFSASLRPPRFASYGVTAGIRLPKLHSQRRGLTPRVEVLRRARIDGRFQSRTTRA